ncbi:phosphatidylserine decarboxylase family protein [archaeon SCG-AAA382B04]|nr:phosphatidylserine decarboxylase family protein [archaeon SCG-AAA382B04]
MTAIDKKIAIKFFLPLILFSLIFLYFEVFLVFIVLLLVLLFLIFFFRDPNRNIPQTGVVSPADGRIKKIKKTREGGIEISIFMGPFDVHVNRSPIGGLVNEVKHKKGKHIPAFKKESEKNERTIIKLKKGDSSFIINQIAGFMARRIYSFVEANEKLKKGERIGLIALGSRVNLLLPPSINKEDLLVDENDKVRAGETKIANNILDLGK